MTRPPNIQWPFGFTDRRTPNNVPGTQHGTQKIPDPTIHGFLSAISEMTELERRELFTWLRQMIDHYGLDSATAIERGIDQE